MRVRFFELRAAFGIDEGGDRIGKLGGGVVLCGNPLRLDEDGPTRAKPPERAVQPGRGGDEFGGRG